MTNNVEHNENSNRPASGLVSKILIGVRACGRPGRVVVSEFAGRLGPPGTGADPAKDGSGPRSDADQRLGGEDGSQRDTSPR